MLGFVVLGLASYLAFVVLPTRRPITDSERAELSQHAGVDENAWRFAAPVYSAALAAVGALGFVGLAVVLRGATYRPRVQVTCRRCKMRVLAEPSGFGFRCLAGHSAAAAPLKIALLVLFLLSAAALGGLTVIASLG
jgi:hypothetical protein